MLNVAKLIWWWQLQCKDGWTLDSISKLGWELKIKSIFKDELFEIYVGLLISWCKPFCEVTPSIYLPSLLVISLLYKFLDFELEYLKLIQNCLETMQNHHMCG